ncbi:hypothetical protein MRB53_017958 [Persea americana]|uniref:Uncharacterized protein n=1 Tax=Persea americana TaxID=3435 RepID=A0ACC2M7H4_PERAE|nr:hypothetical protein MRB53_017958 [Persea americana]
MSSAEKNASGGSWEEDGAQPPLVVSISFTGKSDGPRRSVPVMVAAIVPLVLPLYRIFVPLALRRRRQIVKGFIHPLRLLVAASVEEFNQDVYEFRHGEWP